MTPVLCEFVEETGVTDIGYSSTRKSRAVTGKARWPHSQDGCATSHESFFARRDFLRNSVGAHFHHELSGCHVFLVFLVAADLGGIETPLRRSGGVRLENYADGRGGLAEVARTGGMVLPAQRVDEPLALHVAKRFVRTSFAGIFGAQSRGGGSA